MIGVTHLDVELGGRRVLSDVTLAVAPGELVALCGPNGAGKSTLLRALAGLLPDMAAVDPRRVAWLPQGARSAWGLTVEQVAALGRIPHHDRAEAPVTKALQLCGIEALRKARVDRISAMRNAPASDAKVIAISKGIKALLDTLRDKAPKATIILMGIFPRNDGTTPTAVMPSINKINEHIAKLASKGYQRQFDSTPEFVVMFVPSDGIYQAALAQDPALIEYGVQQQVLMAIFDQVRRQGLLSQLTNIDQYTAAMSDYIRTDFSRSEMLSLSSMGTKLQAENIQRYAIDPTMVVERRLPADVLVLTDHKALKRLVSQMVDPTVAAAGGETPSRELSLSSTISRSARRHAARARCRKAAAGLPPGRMCVNAAGSFALRRSISCSIRSTCASVTVRRAPPGPFSARHRSASTSKRSFWIWANSWSNSA